MVKEKSKSPKKTISSGKSSPKSPGSNFETVSTGSNSPKAMRLTASEANFAKLAKKSSISFFTEKQNQKLQSWFFSNQKVQKTIDTCVSQ